MGNEIALLIASLLAATGVVWALTSVSTARGLSRLAESVCEECRLAGEEIIAGPRTALFRGALHEYEHVTRDGVLVVTDRRLIFRQLGGQGINLPLGDVADARVPEWIEGQAEPSAAGSMHLVVHTMDHNQMVFVVTGAPAFRAALLERTLPGSRLS